MHFEAPSQRIAIWVERARVIGIIPAYNGCKRRLGNELRRLVTGMRDDKNWKFLTQGRLAVTDADLNPIGTELIRRRSPSDQCGMRSAEGRIRDHSRGAVSAESEGERIVV